MICFPQVRDQTVRDAFAYCKDSDFSAAPDTFPPDRFNAGNFCFFDCTQLNVVNVVCTSRFVLA